MQNANNYVRTLQNASVQQAMLKCRASCTQVQLSFAQLAHQPTKAPMQIIDTIEGQLYYQYRVATPVVQINDANIV